METHVLIVKKEVNRKITNSIQRNNFPLAMNQRKSSTSTTDYYVDYIM